MDTTVTKPGSVATTHRTDAAQRGAAPLEANAARPERVETPQAVPPADRAQKPVLKQAAPNSALTTYKDQDSGRLIVRVYDRESGDILIEFPPEKAFRTVAEVLHAVTAQPQKFTKA